MSIKLAKTENGIDMTPYLCDERKRNALIKQQFGRTKVHSIYGKIPDNKGMAFYLIENHGPNINDDIIKKISEKFGYNYIRLKKTYNDMVEISNFFAQIRN